MIKSKLIFSFIILFQLTFFVGCNQPEMSIENTGNPKTEKRTAVFILEKKEKTEKEISGLQFTKTNKLSEVDSLPIITNEKSVVITAILDGETDCLKGLTAAIVDQQNNKNIATSTNFLNNKINFSPIASGLKKLRVNVSGENFPKSYSKTFDTENGEDKEVHINLPPGVTIIGTAFLPDGSPVTGKVSISVSPSDESKGNFQPGKIINEQIQPDGYGNFKLSRLAQGFFDIKCELENHKIFKTNLYLTPAETELNFSFSGVLELELRGKVINGFDKKPIEGIKVCIHPWRNKPAYDSNITDKSGIFSLNLKNADHSDRFFGELIINEPGFGKVVRQIHSEGKFDMITIALWPAGQISGTITTEAGKPIPGLVVNADNHKFAKSYSYNIKTVSKVNFSKDNYLYQSSPSDIDGKYLIKNVVAPMKYGIFINGYSNPKHYSTPTLFSPDVYIAEAEPDKIVVCNLIAKQSAIIAIKARDEKNMPLLNYKMNHTIWSKNGGGSGGSGNINFKEDKWRYFIARGSGEGTFACTAHNSEKGLALVTNNIPFTAEKTNYFILHFNKTKPNITGYLLNVDGTPAENANCSAIMASLKNGKRGESISCRIDSLGYFTITGLKAKENEMIGIWVSDFSRNLTLITNVHSGSKDVELRFTKPKEIIGKVFFDTLDVPATNFIITRYRYKSDQSFNSPDGAFVYKINNNVTVEGEITISAENYLPEKIDFDLTQKSVLDVGNIILTPGETADIKGRVVNQNGKPLQLNVYLTYKKSDEKLRVRSDINTGSYGFEGVSPGEAFVSAKSLEFSVSNSFKINEGDDLDLPDLVLTYTNAAYVTINFKLPDGSFPAHARIKNKSFYIDGNGKINDAFKAGNYSNWEIEHKGKKYIADDFEVTEFTDEIEVQLRELSE